MQSNTFNDNLFFCNELFTNNINSDLFLNNDSQSNNQNISGNNIIQVKSEMDLKNYNNQLNQFNSIFKDQQMQQNNESEQNNNQNIQSNEKNYKNNKKNAYIKKIKSLITLNGLEKSEEISQKQSIGLDQMDNLDSNNVSKLQRNRYTARVSRQRKKYYIELLEKKLEELLAEKHNIQESNKQYKQYIQPNQKQILNKIQNDMINKLQQSLSDNQFNEQQVKLVLESFQNKVGTNSLQRQKLIEGVFKQFKDNFIPECQKLILLDKTLNLTQNHREEIFQIKENYDLILKQADQLKLFYQKVNNNLDEVIQKITKKNKPSTIAHFIVNHSSVSEQFKIQYPEWFSISNLKQSEILNLQIKEESFQMNLKFQNLDQQHKKIKFDKI